MGVTKNLFQNIEYILKYIIKIQAEENDYVGCEFLVSEDNKKGWLG